MRRYLALLACCSLWSSVSYAQVPQPFRQLPITPKLVVPATPNLGQQLPGAGNRNGFGGQAAGNAAVNNQPVTFAPQLIDILQGTVAPQSWGVNGGPGAACFFQPGHGLVIRQTQENHEVIANVLEQLRRAGN